MLEQDKLTTAIAVLLMGIFVVTMSLFLSRLGRKVTAGRWPHAQATGAWSLLTLGAVSIALGLNLATWVPSNWGQSAGLICFQIGGFLVLTSICWLRFLDLRYPVESSGVLNTPRPRSVGRGIAFESFYISMTVGYLAFNVLYWTNSSLNVAIGAGFAAFVLALCTAPFLITRMLRQRSLGE